MSETYSSFRIHPAMMLAAVGVWLSVGCGVSAAGSVTTPVGQRTDNMDGSANISVWMNLPTGFNGKFGADFALNRDGAASLQPNSGPLAANRPEAAWAKLPLNGAAQRLGWDAASVEARADFGGDDTRLTGHISRVLAKRNGMALTLTQSASASHALDAAHQIAASATSLAANSALALNLAGTGTNFSLGTGVLKDRMSPQPTLGAEQQLFGGIKLSASFGRAEDGNVQSSFAASFKRTW